MGTKKIVLTEYFDDLTGDALTEDQVEVVHFGWKNVAYEIDLSKIGAAKVEKFLQPYVEAARRVGGGRGRPAKAGGSTRAPSGSGLSKEELSAARAWLKQNGHEVNDRGRIRGELLDLYSEAHKTA